MAQEGRTAMASGGTAALRGAAGQEGSNLLERIRAWLYEGVNTGSQQVSGSLVKVETGMQNDDYVEILSGLSEGDVVLYTGSTDSTSGFTGGMMIMSAGGGGGRDNRGGMPGGF